MPATRPQFTTMVDTPHKQTDSHSHSHSKFDRVWITIAVSIVLLAILDINQMMSTVRFAGSAILGTAPFILFAILTIGGLKASGAETLIAKAFTGNQLGMIVVAALLGGLSTFCSWEMIPFIAAFLMLGIPLSTLMAFWLTSPLMDPTMFLINASTLGWDFAPAKTLATIAISLFCGTVTMALADPCLLRAPLRDIQHPSA